MTSLSKAFTLSSKRNPCRLCGDVKGKCRDSEQIILCMELSGDRKGDRAVANDGTQFEYRKLSSNGLWGVWAEVRDDSRGLDFDRAEWQARKAAEAEARQRELAAAMPASERDTWYRNYFAGLPLSDSDRAMLQSKGLSDSQINEWGIKSLEFGTVYPIRDSDGLIVGAQIRLTEPGDTGRYRWHNTPQGKQLPDTGELPLAVFHGVSDGDTVALAEGTGVKPYILNQRSGLLTVGAAGGLFGASAQTLKTTLQTCQVKRVRFYPDAGCFVNKGSVMSQYQQLFTMLVDWGYAVEIGYWGHGLSKVEPDIDELPDWSRIEYLSVSRFLALAAEAREAQRRQNGKITFERDESREAERDARDRLRAVDLGPQITRAEWERIKLQQDIKKIYGKTAWRYYKRFGKLPQNAAKQASGQRLEPGETSAIVPYNANQNGWWSLDVTPDSIPTPDEWVAMGRPKLIFAPEHGAEIYKRLLGQYQVILDSSIVGDGKSRRVGELLGQWDSLTTGNQSESTPAANVTELDGFKIGDRVRITLKQFSKSEQKEIIRNNEVPVGEVGLVLGFEKSRIGGGLVAVIQFSDSQRRLDTIWLEPTEIIEHDGFRVGDRVRVTVDRFSLGEQKEIIRNNEVPVGETGVITGFRPNQLLPRLLDAVVQLGDSQQCLGMVWLEPTERPLTENMPQTSPAVDVPKPNLQQWLEAGTKAFYCSTDYRNPSNATLEQIEESVSGAGLVIDASRRTPNGNPYRRRANKGESPDIEPLCVEDRNIQALRAKGISVGRGQNSPFCQVCPHFEGCSYLAAVKEQENITRLRTDLNKVSIKDEQVVLFVDEAGRAAKGSQVLTTWADTARREMMYLASYDPDQYQKLLPVLTQLTQGLERAVNERGKFGLTHEQVLGFLPSEAQIRELLMQSDWYSWTRSDDIWAKPTLNQIIGMFRKAMSPNLEAAFKNTDSSEQRAQVIDLELTIGLLPTLLKAIVDDRWIDISIKSNGEIAITKGNKQHSNTVQNAVSAVLLDATPDIGTIARNLGLRQRDILQIEAKRPTFENLKIKLPRGLGKLGKQREHYHRGKVIETPYSQKNRVLAAVDAIAKIEKDRVPDGAIGLLELKAYLNTYDGVELLADAVKGYHFADNRNSNRFKECTSLISIGAVVPNLNSLLSDWHVMTGETVQSPRFWSWVQRQQTAEIIQGIGRLRAQHRPNQELTCWILTDLSDRDIAAIQQYYPGCQVEQLDIYDICPAAAPKGIQTDRGIVESMWTALKCGTDASINTIAAAVGVSKGRVSQVASTFQGGFRGLKQSLVLLLETLKSKTKLHLLDENERWIAQQYLPAIANELDCNSPDSVRAALQEFVSVAEGAGASAFKRILASTPQYAVVRLFGAFLSLTPDEFQADLLAFRNETLALTG